MKILRALLVVLLPTLVWADCYSTLVLLDGPCTYWRMDHPGCGTVEPNLGADLGANDGHQGITNSGTSDQEGVCPTNITTAADGIPGAFVDGSTHFTLSKPSAFFDNLGYTGQSCVNPVTGATDANPCTPNIPPATIGHPAINDFTVECWTKPASTPGGDMVIIGKGNYAATNAPFIFAVSQDGTTLKYHSYIFVGGGSAKYASGDTTAHGTVGTWNYVAMRSLANLTPAIQTFVDGVGDASSSTDLQPTLDCEPGASARMRVGVFTQIAPATAAGGPGPAPYPEPYDGDIDECAVYAGALSPADIANHWAAGMAGGLCAGHVDWPFNVKLDRNPLEYPDGISTAALLQDTWVMLMDPNTCGNFVEQRNMLG